MSHTFKDIDKQNHTYYLFNDIINIKKFDPNKIKIDKKSYKNIIIYYIGYVTFKISKYLRINSCKFFIPYYQQSELIPKTHMTVLKNI